MKRIPSHALIAFALFAAAGCVPPVNYGLNSVPEEGKLRFAALTANEDRVAGPTVYPSREYGLVYGVMKPFDVSPDGQTLAYLALKNDKVNVFLKGTGGGVATTQRTFRDSIYDVSFGSDGSRIAFTDLRNRRFNVYEISATQGAAIKQITNFEQVSRYPVYSPTANKLMYVQYEPSVVTTQQSGSGGGGLLARRAMAAVATAVTVNRYYVWEIDLEKNAFTQYTEGYAPAFSPDGKRLAITRNSRDHGNSEIWVIDLATGTETLVASSKIQGYSQPSFSPDGKRLVFTGVTLKEKTRPANFDVFVVDINGSNITQLSFHPGHDLAGRFSPDGKSVYFLSQRGNTVGAWNVWRMDFER